jgi:leader peptidase (prepilin peptidase)/N-methyltransferase
MTFRDANLTTALTRAFSTAGTIAISSATSFVTLVTIVAAAAIAVRFGLSPAMPAFCYLAIVGVPLAFIDARLCRLPDLATLPSYPACLLLLGVAAPFVTGGPGRFGHALIGMVAAVGFFALLLVLSPAGIGLGDVKLAGPLGAYLGWLGAAAFVTGLMAAWLLAALTALALLLTRRATRKTQIPFGPFLIAATLGVVLLSGVVPALAT